MGNHRPVADMTLPGEAWGDIPGREGAYQVSTFGRVRGLDRVVMRDGHPMSLRGRLLIPWVNKGYLWVRLGARSKRAVHEIVLTTFAGPKPNGAEACHCNGNRADNRRENLRWDSHAANMADAIAHGRTNRGERHPASRLTDDAVILARAEYRSGATVRKIAHCLGVAEQAVADAIRGKSWVHLPGAVPLRGHSKTVATRQALAEARWAISPEQREQARARMTAGESVRRLAVSLGISESACRRIRRERGTDS